MFDMAGNIHMLGTFVTEINSTFGIKFSDVLT